MTKQVLSQAAKLRELVADPQTVTTYKQAGSLTWAILKEAGLLVWLVICLVLVAGEWVVKNTNKAVDSVQTWLETSGQSSMGTADSAGKSAEDRLSETGKSLLEVSKAGLSKAVATAKTQLGIEAQPAAVAPPVAAPPVAPPVAAPAAAPPAAAPTAAPAAVPTSVTPAGNASSSSTPGNASDPVL